MTAGSLMLALGVFRGVMTELYNLTWEKFPWEVRVLCRLFGIKSKVDFDNKLYINKYLLGSEDKLTCRRRFLIDVPIIAALFMIVGMVFCFIN